MHYSSSFNGGCLQHYSLVLWINSNLAQKPNTTQICSILKLGHSQLNFILIFKKGQEKVVSIYFDTNPIMMTACQFQTNANLYFDKRKKKLANVWPSLHFYGMIFG